MRKLVANLALSLDGRTAGPAGEYDMGWIVPHAITDGARTHMVEVTAPATTALLGRKNYQGFGGFWPPIADDENADPKDRVFSRWLNEVEKVVFSGTLTEVEWENARLADGDPAAVVNQLREQDGGDIIVLASMSVIRQLLAAGEVDRLSITLCPEVVGGGAKIFEDGQPGASWALTSSTATESGALCLLYDKKETGR